MKNERIEALALALELNEEEKENLKALSYDERTIKDHNEEYLILTDEETEKAVRLNIENSLWAFNADFIIKHCKNYDDMTCDEFNAAVDSLRQAQANQCESLNGLVYALIDDFEEFVNDAIIADGRGHFLAYYDGRENEATINGTTYYIYRQN